MPWQQGLLVAEQLGSQAVALRQAPAQERQQNRSVKRHTARDICHMTYDMHVQRWQCATWGTMKLCAAVLQCNTRLTVPAWEHVSCRPSEHANWSSTNFCSILCASNPTCWLCRHGMQSQRTHLKSRTSTAHCFEAVAAAAAGAPAAAAGGGTATSAATTSDVLHSCRAKGSRTLLHELTSSGPSAAVVPVLLGSGLRGV